MPCRRGTGARIPCQSSPVRDLPVDRLLPHLLQRLVDGRIRLTPQELRRRQRRRVRRLHHPVLLVLHQLRLLLRVPPPQREHHRLLPVVQRPDGGVGELLPPLVLVRVRRLRPHGQ